MADNYDQLDEDQEIFAYPGGRKKSRVWKTFGFLKKGPGPATRENLDMTRALCRICKKSYVNKGKVAHASFVRNRIPLSLFPGHVQ